MRNTNMVITAIMHIIAVIRNKPLLAFSLTELFFIYDQPSISLNFFTAPV